MLWSYLHLLFVALWNCHLAEASQLSDAVNCFSLNLYKKLAVTEPNLISCPLGADVLLSLLLGGSAGTTAEQLRKALKYDNPKLDIDDMQKGFKSVLDSLVSSDGNTLQIANSMWVQNSFHLSSNFYNLANEYFNAYVDGSMEFHGNPKNATDTINNWAKSNTNGLIEKIFDVTLPKDTLLVLVNALYFKGNWEKKFKTTDTFSQTFFNNGNQAKPVLFMNQRQRFSWNHDDDLKAQLLEMNYKGGQVSMTIVLPDDESNLADMEKSFTCDTLKNSYQYLYENVVQVTIPKFTASANLDLKQPLKSLGVSDLFSEDANLSGLLDGQPGNDRKLAVGNIVQKAVIKVDEEGSEAAALTAGRICRSCSMVAPEDIRFNANKPFFYFLRHKPTDVILFMGRVSSL